MACECVDLLVGLGIGIYVIREAIEIFREADDALMEVTSHDAAADR
jgi:divalent metal cation (Fe/Co/Zn/Cd) transporter